MDGPTALAVLGLRPGASQAQIKHAFRTRAKAAHPDLAGGADAFVALRRAYEVALSGAAGAGAAAPDAPAPVAAAGRTAVCARPPGDGPAPRPVATARPPMAAPPTARPRWLHEVGGGTGRTLDVRDIARPPVTARPRPVRDDGFEAHLAAALAS